VADGKVSKHEAVFRPPWTEKKNSCGLYFPSMRTEIYVLKALFSIPRDIKVSKPEAIFHPPRTDKKTIWTLFSVSADGKISMLEAIFRLPLTKK